MDDLYKEYLKYNLHSIMEYSFNKEKQKYKIESLKKETEDKPCKFCKTLLHAGETPCWKCGTNDPTEK